MKEMSIDLETFSDIDISKSGVYKYAESDRFEILLFGVSIDGGPVQVYDLACGDHVPEEILSALADESVTKWAFNASFERICLSNRKTKKSGNRNLSSDKPRLPEIPCFLHFFAILFFDF